MKGSKVFILQSLLGESFRYSAIVTMKVLNPMSNLILNFFACDLGPAFWRAHQAFNYSNKSNESLDSDTLKISPVKLQLHPYSILVYFFMKYCTVSVYLIPSNACVYKASLIPFSTKQIQLIDFEYLYFASRSTKSPKTLFSIKIIFGFSYFHPFPYPPRVVAWHTSFPPFCTLSVDCSVWYIL